MTTSTFDPETPAVDRGWFGHPRQLARLFSTEMWERFGFYGMRVLLTLYLTKHFLFSDTVTTGLYGGFTALVYLTPLIGGLVADRMLGAKRSVKFGALVMSVGYFTLCFGGPTAAPNATFDGHTYPVQIVNGYDRPTSTGEEQRYVVMPAGKLKIHGNADGSIDLQRADGSIARHLVKDGLVSGGIRPAFYTALLVLGLTLITVGNGFFKPNISTIVGSLYPAGDTRRDAGFSIFYMGINLGSLFSQLLCPVLADHVGWWAGFGLAAIGMLASWALIQFDGGRLAGHGDRPEGANPAHDWRVWVGSLVAVPVVCLLLVNLMDYVKPAAGSGIVGYLISLPIMGKVMFATFTIAVPGILIWSRKNGSRQEFQMMCAAMVLVTFNTVFWTLFEQAGSSLTLFADRNTDLHVTSGFSMSAGQTQFFNAIFIVILAPIFSIVWQALGKRGLEPSIPVKFGIALCGAGAGFLLLVFGARFAGPDARVALGWLAGLYFVHSVAELCISPVGLSMITKLSIARIVGMMMGVWFLSISVAQYVAGMVAQVASVQTVGGEVTNPRLSLETYVGVFTTIGWVAVGIGVLLLIIALPLRRWMHGVR